MLDTILQWLKRLGLGGALILGVVYIVFCAYSLPRHIVVHVTGTEVTRRDVEQRDGNVRTRDVRYIMAEDLEGGAHMFRNQDTGWGWPPYFKFNSGDLAAEARNYSVDHDKNVVLVTFYGFRIRILSMFPNVLSMKLVPADYQPVPWTTIVFAVLNIVVFGCAWIFLRHLTRSLDDDI